MPKKNPIKIKTLPPRNNVKGGLYSRPMTLSQTYETKTAPKPQSESSQLNETVIRLLNIMVLSSCGAFMAGFMTSLLFDGWRVAIASIIGGGAGFCLAAALWIAGKDEVENSIRPD